MSATGLVEPPPDRPRAADRGAGPELLALGRPAIGAEISGPAVGRPAAARGAGPRARDLARPAAARRALSALDARVRAAPARTRSRRLQRRLGVTIMVTHDQEEALDHGRSHRGHEPGCHRAGRHAAGDLPPAHHRVRGRLRRLDELPRRALDLPADLVRWPAYRFACLRSGRAGWRPARRGRRRSLCIRPRGREGAQTCRPTSPTACRSRWRSSIRLLRLLPRHSRAQARRRMVALTR